MTAVFTLTVFTCLVTGSTWACGGSMCSKPIDCQDIQDLGNDATGIYTIFPQGTRGFKVRCDMDTTTGGWTVIQRRVSNAIDFYKTWIDYQTFFGDLTGNYWIGNQPIHMLTSQGWYQLRVDMRHANGTSAYAEYNYFAVGDVDSKYKLTVDGYKGDAGDNLIPRHNGMKFTTRDSDNDIYTTNCANRFNGGWWYEKCHVSNLNGIYGNNNFGKGLNWYSFTGFQSSLTYVDMKIRRWTA